MLFELDESAPDKSSGYHEARTAGKFPGGELAVRSLARRLARQFSNPLGNAEPKRPEPFLLYVRAESAPGVRRFEKNEGPNSALDLAALFTQVFHVALLSRGEAQAFALADGISNVRDGNQHGQELSGRVGMKLSWGPAGVGNLALEPCAKCLISGGIATAGVVAVFEEANAWSAGHALWKFRFRLGFGPNELTGQVVPCRSRLWW